jgi:hypothetical protein
MIKKVLTSFFLISNFCFSAEEAARVLFKSQFSHANEETIYKLFLSNKAVETIDVVGENFFKQYIDKAILKCCKNGYLKTFFELLEIKEVQESTWNADFMKACLQTAAKDSLHYNNSSDGIEECEKIFGILCEEVLGNNVQMNQQQLDKILDATDDWIMAKTKFLDVAKTQNSTFSTDCLKRCFISSLSDGIFHGAYIVDYMQNKNIKFNSHEVNDILSQLSENKFDPNFYEDFQNDLLSVSFNPAIN